MAAKKKAPASAEISSFCSQVALILGAGLPLYDGMETLAETSKGSEFADMYAEASKGVTETGSLYEALKRDGRWPAYLVEMTGIGEQTGYLRLNRDPIYFDLLGNRLKSKPRNGMYVIK